jgi:hypothetical protein
MTAAQKKAQDNFKKAIAYRKKTGCTLKQAFAKFKKPTIKKAAPKKKTIKKAVKKVGAIRKKVVIKKEAPKKAQLKKVNSHKDTKSHNVNIRVVSGVSRMDNLTKYGFLIKDEKVKKMAIQYCKDKLKNLPLKEKPALRKVILEHEKELKIIKQQMALQKKII